MRTERTHCERLITLLGISLRMTGESVPDYRMDPFRYSGLSPANQREIFLNIVWNDPLCREALELAREFDLPHWRIVSGALYNTIWNHLTGKPSGRGIKDIDLFYFDASDLSYEAEDVHIKSGA